MNETDRCVLFDMNGVIVNSEPINISTWKALYNEYGLEFSPEIYLSEIDGKTTREIAETYLNNEVDQNTFIERKDKLWDMICKKSSIQLFEDTVYCLTYLRKKGYKLGVVTSSRKGKRVLSEVGLSGFFDTIITGDMVKIGKPAPDIIIAALKSLSIPAENTILVEDSIGGVYAGLQAGVFVVGLDRSDLNRITNSNITVKSLFELCDLIDREALI